MPTFAVAAGRPTRARGRRAPQRRVRDPDRFAPRARRTKFIGDAARHLAFDDADQPRLAPRVDAAISNAHIEGAGSARIAAGGPVPGRLALHLGNVLYGNVGAIDRLDFTVIGPAINEVARIEALCQPLGRAVLVSAEFVEGMKGADSRLKSLGGHALRGVKERKEIFALELRATPA
jgi:adenylate cyclase